MSLGQIMPRLLGADYWDLFNYPTTLTNQDFGVHVDPSLTGWWPQTPYDPRSAMWAGPWGAPLLTCGFGFCPRHDPWAAHRAGTQPSQKQQQGQQVSMNRPQSTQAAQQSTTEAQQSTNPVVPQQPTPTASIVNNEQRQFTIALDCRHFEPSEVEVTHGENNQIVVHGKHEEKCDDHGYVSREFTRRYMLPKDCELEKIRATWTPTKQLRIECPKRAPVARPAEVGSARTIPIEGVAGTLQQQQPISTQQQSPMQVEQEKEKEPEMEQPLPEVSIAEPKLDTSQQERQAAATAATHG